MLTVEKQSILLENENCEHQEKQESFRDTLLSGGDPVLPIIYAVKAQHVTAS